MPDVNDLIVLPNDECAWNSILSRSLHVCTTDLLFWIKSNCVRHLTSLLANKWLDLRTRLVTNANHFKSIRLLRLIQFIDVRNRLFAWSTPCRPEFNDSNFWIRNEFALNHFEAINWRRDRSNNQRWYFLWNRCQSQQSKCRTSEDDVSHGDRVLYFLRFYYIR